MVSPTMVRPRNSTRPDRAALPLSRLTTSFSFLSLYALAPSVTLRRRHEDVAIIREPEKCKAAPLQLLVQLVEGDVAEQGVRAEETTNQVTERDRPKWNTRVRRRYRAGVVVARRGHQPPKRSRPGGRR